MCALATMPVEKAAPIIKIAIIVLNDDKPSHRDTLVLPRHFSEQLLRNNRSPTHTYTSFTDAPTCMSHINQDSIQFTRESFIGAMLLLLTVISLAFTREARRSLANQYLVTALQQRAKGQKVLLSSENIRITLEMCALRILY